MKKLSIVAKSILMCSFIAMLTTGCFGKKAEMPATPPAPPAENIQQPAAPAANEMQAPAANKQGYIQNDTKRVALINTNNDLAMNQKAIIVN